jgi:hypothetical protein
LTSKKQLFAVSVLIIVGITAIAWAQSVISVITLTPASYDPTVTVTTPAFEITADSKGTAEDNGTLVVDNVHFNYTALKVSLIDLSGLYQSMKSLTVTFIDTTDNVQYAYLTLDTPAAEFLFNSTTTAKASDFTVNFLISWIAEPIVASPIQFAVSAEVVGTYDYKES